MEVDLAGSGLVLTTKGLVEGARLKLTIVPFVEENGLTLATEYRLDGELVKRSVWHDSYRGLEMKARAGEGTP